MYKNVLLIEPKSPDVNIYSKFKMPRMGLAILGTQAHEAGYHVRIVYQETTKVTSEHFLWADVIGFSLTTSTSPEGYRLAEVARSLDQYRNRSTVIVFGGVHPTFLPEEALLHGDYVFRGEAEPGFVPFLDSLNNGGDLDRIPGLSRWVNQTVRHNPPADEKVEMDSLPTPDWSLFEGLHTDITGVMTSRGCPYDCSFCSVTAMFGRTYRMRSIDNIIDDLASLTSRHVFFYDDHFLANPRRTEALLRRIIAEQDRRISIREFSAQVRVEIAKYPHILDLMKEAGFTTLYIGFESVNNETLKLYNKKQNLKEIVQSIREIRKRGIWIHGMFVLGSDADTARTFPETVRFARRNKIDSVQFLILTPFPGTQQFETFEAEQRMLSYEWSRFDGFQAVYLPRQITPYQLQKWNLRAMLRFYTWPRVISSIVRLKLFEAVIRLYGRVSLLTWYRHNRGLLKKLKQDDRHFFVPVRTGAAAADQTVHDELATI